MNELPLIKLESCPKNWKRDLDKAIDPEQTWRDVNARLARVDQDIVAEVRRIDTGRLGIPVYLGVCGSDARRIMPTRKQMGKGSSPAQARASALMELMERYAFFGFWQRQPAFVHTDWQTAKKRFGPDLISPEELLISVNDSLPLEQVEKLLNLHSWQFYPATRLPSGKHVWLPLDWFRMLGEFNGSSAGNTAVESLLQGVSELVERHVCCLVDRERPTLPTISQADVNDEILAGLLASFKKAGVNLLLKDFSLGMPLPTVGALAWDPSTFPEKSEIVFTAGTATSPIKAAIRAVTEVAQLAGDFESSSCYEASGLPKFSSLDECAWLQAGPMTGISDLPGVEHDDMLLELQEALRKMQPFNFYAVETTDPELGIPAHYCIAPGLQFRERARTQSLGLFIGRKLAEEKSLEEALAGLELMGGCLGDQPYLPFFQGLSYLNNGQAEKAPDFFEQALKVQTDPESHAMSCFYAGYSLEQLRRPASALPYFREAARLCPDMKEYHNYLGVNLYRQKLYAEAEEAFNRAIALDKGSAMDLANRGIARKFQGKKEEAREDLLIALSLDPTLDFAARHLQELDQA